MWGRKKTVLKYHLLKITCHTNKSNTVVQNTDTYNPNLLLYSCTPYNWSSSFSLKRSWWTFSRGIRSVSLYRRSSSMSFSSSAAACSAMSCQRTSSSVPSVLLVRQQILNPFAMMAGSMSFQAFLIHCVIRGRSGFFILPPAVKLWFSYIIQVFHWRWTPSLNTLFIQTSSTWSWDVMPPGITTKSVLCRSKSF